MKALHLTDIEGYTPTIPDNLLENLNFVLISGDISIGARSIPRVAKSFRKIRAKIPNEIPIYFVPGNREYDAVAGEFEGLPENIYPLHNRYSKYSLNDGRNVFLIGFGGALPGIQNNFEKTEEDFKEALEILFKKVLSEKNTEDIMILVVHNPPINCTLDKTFLKTHIGSKSVRDAIELYKPDVLVCGHVHESHGIETIGKTICVNPGASKFGNASLIEFNPEIKITLVKIEAKR